MLEGLILFIAAAVAAVFLGIVTSGVTGSWVVGLIVLVVVFAAVVYGGAKLVWG